MKLQKEINSVFAAKYKPNTNQVVIADGYDALEKERAVEFFSGKSSKDVLEHVRSRKADIVAGGDYRLEEWSVLKPTSRYYYLCAYLEFLLETLSEDEPDGAYISEFFHQLYQTVFMYEADAYSDKQEALLRKIATFTLEAVENHEEIQDSSDGIVDNINAFLSELKKHD